MLQNKKHFTENVILTVQCNVFDLSFLHPTQAHQLHEGPCSFADLYPLQTVIKCLAMHCANATSTKYTHTSPFTSWTNSTSRMVSRGIWQLTSLTCVHLFPMIFHSYMRAPWKNNISRENSNLGVWKSLTFIYCLRHALTVM